MDALGKLSVATMGCNAALAKANNIKTAMARVMGTATGLKQAIGTDGDVVFGLTGQFLGQNIATGKEFTSGVLYLPGGLQELIQAPLETMLNDPDKSVVAAASVEFALDLFAIPAGNKAGYSYVGTLLGDATRADPFAAIKAKVGAMALPALPSPAEIAKAQAAKANAATGG